MNNKILEISRAFVKQHTDNLMVKDLESRPHFHMTAPVGWMNDPNGFSVYQGEYHLFYQYYPYGTKWGPMHWGHCITKDFIRWEQLPCTLAPEDACDFSGCFSGTALEWEGKHILMYTGATKAELFDGTILNWQKQCIARGDGINYQKETQNPVISSDLLPENAAAEDFRDPKLWRENGEFYALIASKDVDNYGQLLLYKSSNLTKWQYVSQFLSAKDGIGGMWECPDFFSIGGRDAVIVSVLSVDKKEGCFNEDSVIGMIGKYDREMGTFKRESYEVLDYGADFYAPQTLCAKDGRRIMIAWLRPSGGRLAPKGFSWFGMMSIPRELKLKDGRLYQCPVSELDGCRKKESVYKDITIEEEFVKLPGVSGRCLDLTVEAALHAGEAFYIRFAWKENTYTEIGYNKKDRELYLDRSRAENITNPVPLSKVRIKEKNGKLKLRIILDVYSAEVFVNEGSEVISAAFYTPIKAGEVGFRAEGRVLLNVQSYTL